MPKGLMSDNPSPFWGEGSGYGKRLTKWIGLDDLAAGIPGASDWQAATPGPSTYLAETADWTGTPAPLEAPAPDDWAPDPGAIYDAGLPALGAAEMQPAELPKPPDQAWDFDPAPIYGSGHPSAAGGRNRGLVRASVSDWPQAQAGRRRVCR
jgi:hypothetical protein